MRRSRAPLTAWPAFADLMTIIAVVGLAGAAVVLNNAAELQSQLDDANDTIEKQQDRNRELEDRNRELELRTMFPGGRPCLWNSGPPITVVPLLQIVVASEYVVTPLWPQERSADVAAIPRLVAAIEHGPMDVADFDQYSNAIYQHGRRADTFRG